MASNFNSIWDEFNVPIRIFIKRRVNNEQDVEDILQNVFIKIYNNIDNLYKLNIHAWVYKVTRNTIIDYYRMRKHEFDLSEFKEDILPYENLDEDTVIRDISQCLIMMIQYLPEKYKQALTLTEVKNISQKELAYEAGLSVSGAKSRVQRARILLKEDFLSCCSLETDERGNIFGYELKNKECNFCKS
ncbi:hypothetical protein SDC9_122369 [bioreactor metagenome]|uniref:RNA polymerase sigma factor SigZ n=1 Tax=bioreactor metagenome TaxID=1076179 RepID=A0A645CEJ3_9ZZZZ|nr:RNA polymerase sigma factor SigZ [Lachnospiraceae bacterium]